MSKKFLIFADFLGFEALPRQIENRHGMEENTARQFLKTQVDTMLKQIKNIEYHQGTDDYLFACDSLEKTFEVVYKITSIKIPFPGFTHIPFEIGIDEVSSDDASVSLTNRASTIGFLKNDLIKPYHDKIKSELGIVRNTFIAFTKNVYERLDPVDRLSCEKFQHINQEIYILQKEFFHHRQLIGSFLTQINKSGSTLFDKIDRLYVYPREYEDIRKSLQKNQVVFITGTKEFGKTFTAVRLLWEFFLKGYEPRWISGEEDKHREQVREKLIDIEKELRSNHVIYFEDPFGKTKYESNDSLEREITTIIEKIRGIENVFVIITSREEVYKEFENEKLSPSDLKQFEQKLNIKKPSYDITGRKKLLENYAISRNCKWINDSKLKSHIFQKIETEGILPSPFSIRNFAIASSNVSNLLELNRVLEEKSRETAAAFADEIKNMTDDKVIFLLLLLIKKHGGFYEYFRDPYYDLIKELKITDFWDFEHIIDWFKDDKIDIANSIVFSHPSYYESLGFLLSDNFGFPSRINKSIFSIMLLRLSSSWTWASDVANVLRVQFDKIIPEIRNELIERFASQSVHRSYWSATDLQLAYCFAENFQKISNQTQKRIFHSIFQHWPCATVMLSGILLNVKPAEMSDWQDSINSAITKHYRNDEFVSACVNNFSILSESTQDYFLAITSQFADSGISLERTLHNDFSKLSQTNREILLQKMQYFDYFKRDISRLVMTYPKKINSELLMHLLENLIPIASDVMASYMHLQFKELPAPMRNELLIKLLPYANAKQKITYCLADNFDIIPIDVRNAILQELFNDVNYIGFAIRITVSQFRFLPTEITDKMFSLSKSEYGLDVVWAIAENYDNLPSNIQEIVKNRISDLLELLMYQIESTDEFKIKSKILVNIRHLLPSETFEQILSTWFRNPKDITEWKKQFLTDIT